jgi:hypothetical protein
MSEQKNLLWARAGQLIAFLVLASLSIFSAWVVLGSWLPKSTVLLGSIVFFFICAPVGALWMLYDCSRQEKQALAYFILAFFPYAFVWYYFERVRPRRLRTVAPPPGSAA